MPHVSPAVSSALRAPAGGRRLKGLEAGELINKKKQKDRKKAGWVVCVCLYLGGGKQSGARRGGTLAACGTWTCDAPLVYIWHRARRVPGMKLRTTFMGVGSDRAVCVYLWGPNVPASRVKNAKDDGKPAEFLASLFQWVLEETLTKS